MTFIPIRVRFILGIVAGLVTLAIVQIVENKKPSDKQLSFGLRFAVSFFTGLTVGLITGLFSSEDDSDDSNKTVESIVNKNPKDIESTSS